MTETQIFPVSQRNEAAAPASPVRPASPASLAGVDRVVLTGFMGAGKTTVGRLLAHQLGWAFLDLDSHLEARAGRTVAELFAGSGEAHFRRLESAALASALACTQTVLALGGGTPEIMTNRLLLEQTPGTLVLFLDAPFASLMERCLQQALAGEGSVRPLLEAAADTEARHARRLPHYRRVAHHTVATGQRTAAETSSALTELLYRQHS